MLARENDNESRITEQSTAVRCKRIDVRNMNTRSGVTTANDTSRNHRLSEAKKTNMWKDKIN